MAGQFRSVTIRKRALLFLAAAVLTLIVLSSASAVLSLQGSADSDNPLTLEMSVSPWASTPGDTLSLRLSVRNDGATASMPDISIQLPEQVIPDVSIMPPGTIYSFQSSGLSWQPYIEPQGGMAQIEVWLSVTAAQLKEPEQRIKATIRDNGAESNHETTLWIGSLPQAAISFDSPRVSVGQTLKLNANAIGPGPLTQLWLLDDGRTIAANNPEVVFPLAGSHTVNLQVSNPLGMVSVNGQFEVVPHPHAKFIVHDRSSIADTAISFTNQSGGELPLSYAWDFGDGAVAHEKNPVHHYAAPGVYQVSLQAENTFGTSETSSFIEIGTTPNFEISITDFTEAGSVVRGAVLTDQAISEIIWEMGDGRRHSGREIDHTYWTPGDYVITVTAQNDFGETRISRWIRVGYGTLHYYLPYLNIGSSIDNGLAFGLELPDSSGPIDIGLGPQPELLPIEFAAGTTQAEQLFIYINEARALFNLRPLSYVHSLSVAAQAHTDDMAAYGHTAHAGSDGSSPAYRLQVAGYTGGYGGEATAWGMSDAIEPVRFWLTSPAHRVILLNPAVTEVGVGYTVDFDAPNVWYWTAEFASLHLPVVGASPPELPTPEITPELLLLGPPQNSEFVLSQDAKLIFSWSWPSGIQDNQRFALYLSSQGRTYQAGVVRQPQPSGQYQFVTEASSLAISPGPHTWQIRLEDSSQGVVIAESAIWRVLFLDANQEIPTATPVPTQPASAPPDETAVPPDPTSPANG